MFPFILFTIFVLLFFFTAYVLAKHAIASAKRNADLVIPPRTWVIVSFTLGFGVVSGMLLLFPTFNSNMSDSPAPVMIAIGIAALIAILLIWTSKRVVKHYYPQVIFCKELELPIENLGEKRIGRGLLFSAM